MPAILCLGADRMKRHRSNERSQSFGSSFGAMGGTSPARTEYPSQVMTPWGGRAALLPPHHSHTSVPSQYLGSGDNMHLLRSCPELSHFHAVSPSRVALSLHIGCGAGPPPLWGHWTPDSVNEDLNGEDFEMKNLTLPCIHLPPPPPPFFKDSTMVSCLSSEGLFQERGPFCRRLRGTADSIMTPSVHYYSYLHTDIFILRRGL